MASSTTKTVPSAGLPFVEEIPDLTPWQAVRALGDQSHLLFLDSAAPSPQGRYSYVSADPIGWLRTPQIAPFDAVRRLLPAPLERIESAPPFQGGVAGLFGYGLSRHLERLPKPEFDDFQVPDLAVGLYDWTLAFDLAERKTWLIVTGWPETDPKRRLRRARMRRDDIRRWLDREPMTIEWRPPDRSPIASPRFAVRGSLESNFDRPDYLAMLRRGIDYIHAGDCFQVNLAQRLMVPQTIPSLDLYERLRTRNAAPFAGYFDLGDFAIASASPERFLHLADGQVETRPIKGTRPRGVYPMEDMNRGGDLQESIKDRAENVMIVDLLRNDLGRVCQYGSIEVSAVCQLETFRYVHHLVSEVRGRLRPGFDGIDLLKATFPGGSITGAPKIRAMEIITELERVARGAYCGSLGYLTPDGRMDTNLLIRTLTLGRGWAHFSVGGGIVADSVPEREYEETWHKAAGILRALEE